MASSVVLDVGKTISKLTLWDDSGELLARESRINRRIEGPGYVALDFGGIEDWLLDTLEKFSRLAEVRAIIPVGHGAAAAIVRDGCVVTPPMDYEAPIPSSSRRDYDAQRDPFSATGSPALADGLNLGAQLHELQRIDPDSFHNATILLWPQYWAWVLSGVAASEVTSLGCHSDLWRPLEKRPSDLAANRGWAAMLPPLREASEALGSIRSEVAKRTGLPADTKVYCGLHDSNAALLAARAFPEIADGEATILSTGTWFVALRTPRPGAPVEINALPEGRDCLVNVDAFGRPVPSSRFMGGREVETLTGIDARRIDMKPDQADLLDAVPAVLKTGAMVLPTFAAGVGPYPSARGRWIAMPTDESERRTTVSLYAALVADASLDLIGSCERVVIEGRFAEAEVVVRGLANLRPQTSVYVANAHNDVSFGALRLLNPRMQPDSSLRLVKPLESDLTRYRSDWRKWAEQLDNGA